MHASAWTESKQNALRSYLRVYAAIAAKIQSKHETGPWLYLDLTAGPGLLDHNDGTLEGSPPIACDVFAAAKLDAECEFIEWDAERAQQLEATLGRRDRLGGARMTALVCVYCGDPVRPRDPLVWHRVEGWERPGKAGGSDITLREQVDGFACARCVALKKMGVDVRQESLL